LRSNPLPPSHEGPVAADEACLASTAFVSFSLAWSVTHYWIGGMFSLVASGVAAWIPARRAAGANPVDIIRGAA
jgi:ABC-type antimicrobial peptide transport system permease subunit